MKESQAISEQAKRRNYTWVDRETKEQLWSRVMDGEVMKEVARDLGIKYSNAKNIIKLGR